MSKNKQKSQWDWWQTTIAIVVITIANRIKINEETTILLMELLKQWLE